MWKLEIGNCKLDGKREREKERKANARQATVQCAPPFTAAAPKEEPICKSADTIYTSPPESRCRAYPISFLSQKKTSRKCNLFFSYHKALLSLSWHPKQPALLFDPLLRMIGNGWVLEMVSGNGPTLNSIIQNARPMWNIRSAALPEANLPDVE